MLPRQNPHRQKKHLPRKPLRQNPHRLSPLPRLRKHPPRGLNLPLPLKQQTKPLRQNPQRQKKHLSRKPLRQNLHRLKPLHPPRKQHRLKPPPRSLRHLPSAWQMPTAAL